MVAPTMAIPFQIADSIRDLWHDWRSLITKDLSTLALDTIVAVGLCDEGENKRIDETQKV